MTIKTATVTEFRGKLADYLADLREPLLVLQRGQQAAYVVAPEMFDAMIDRIEFLEDILDGEAALAEIEAGAETIDLKTVKKKLGL